MVIHSLDNILVHVSHVDVFTTNLDDKFGVKKDPNVEVKCKKKTRFIEGGHAILRVTVTLCRFFVFAFFFLEGRGEVSLRY